MITINENIFLNCEINDNESETIKDLENIYSTSEGISLSDKCYQSLSKKSIPIQEYKSILENEGILIITLDYNDDSATTLQEIVNAIGIPHQHNQDKKVIWDVKSVSKGEEKYQARSHQLSEFTFHTDCSYEKEVPDFFGLHVVQHDEKCGGKNLIIDVDQVITQLTPKSLKILQTQLVKIRVPEEFKKDQDFINEVIIDSKFNIRYRKELICHEELNIEQKSALSEIEQLIYSAKFSRSLSLKKGQIILLNNKRFLHARTKIKDQNRHLKRIRFFTNFNKE